MSRNYFLVRLHILVVLENVATNRRMLLAQLIGLAVDVEIQDLEQAQPIVEVEYLRAPHLWALGQLLNIGVNFGDVFG